MSRLKIQGCEQIGFLMRLVVGGVFAYSGWEKLMSSPANFVAVIDQYQFFPNRTFEWISMTVPWMEFSFGVFLLLGFLTRLSAGVLSAFLAFFIFLISRALLIGLPIEDCGCFGSGITLAPHQAIVLDSVLLFFSLAVLFRPSSLLNLDNRLAQSS